MATAAVIQTGGKQYRVSEGDLIRVEVLKGNNGETLEPGAKVEFSEVLLISGDAPKVGAPYVSGARVDGEIVKLGRGPKVITFKFRRRKRSRSKKGHRQDYTAVKITGISG